MGFFPPTAIVRGCVFLQVYVPQTIITAMDPFHLKVPFLKITNSAYLLTCVTYHGETYLELAPTDEYIHNMKSYIVNPNLFGVWIQMY